MRLAIDFHDTLTANPVFFMALLKDWPWRRFIITGTPESERAYVEQTLHELGFDHGRHFNAILMGFEYDRAHMDQRHFMRMRAHKLKLLVEHGVTAVFDDNPIYTDHFRNNGIFVFQPMLSDEYLAKFADGDPYFTAHLQRGQFDCVRRMTA